VLFETSSLSLSKNGGLKHLFRNGVDESSFVLQFEDMSLHHVASDPEEPGSQLAVRWSREEALSDITQVEMASSHSGTAFAQTFDYVKRWDHNQQIHQVPQRILQRYAENAAHLLQALFSMREIPIAQSLQQAKDSEIDIYGFRKTLVAMTSYGKILGLSSYDGKLLWTSPYLPHSDGQPQKIFTR